MTEISMAPKKNKSNIRKAYNELKMVDKGCNELSCLFLDPEKTIMKDKTTLKSKFGI